jgi:hypothetical protein
MMIAENSGVKSTTKLRFPSGRSEGKLLLHPTLRAGIQLDSGCNSGILSRKLVEVFGDHHCLCSR